MDTTRCGTIQETSWKFSHVHRPQCWYSAISGLGTITHTPPQATTTEAEKLQQMFMVANETSMLSNTHYEKEYKIHVTTIHMIFKGEGNPFVFSEEQQR